MRDLTLEFGVDCFRLQPDLYFDFPYNLSTPAQSNKMVEMTVIPCGIRRLFFRKSVKDGIGNSHGIFRDCVSGSI